MTGLIAFALSPFGRIALIGLAFLAWTAYQRDQAADRARAECRADQIQTTLNEVVRQRDAARAAQEAAEIQAHRAQQDMAELETEREKITKDLARDADVDCRIPVNTIERLRNIR
jgi:hypothetical protein